MHATTPLRDMRAHPLVAALLRLVVEGRAGIDGGIEDEDGMVGRINGRIAGPGIRLRIDHDSTGTRLGIDCGLPRSAIAAMAGRTLGDVMDLPPCSGDGWRTLGILSTRHEDMATLDIENGAPETVKDRIEEKTAC